MNGLTWLRELETEGRRAFDNDRRVMDFDSYFATLLESPAQQCRTAVSYLRDCMDHYGTSTLQRPDGPVLHYHLFDCPWDDGQDRLVGQEEAQHRFYRILSNFEREGRVARLVLLHGPNGSAKSSFIGCLARALEDYSSQPEGAVYRFNWVFPTSKHARKRLGFGADDDPGSSESFALLEDDEVDARLPGDLRDHPLLLLPPEARQSLLERLQREGRLPEDRPLGEHLWQGNLSPRSHAIATALLASYKGDLRRVLQHVQVERFQFSRRYRVGCVTIEPQIHVDASARQVTMDEGLQALPPALRHLSLYEPMGDLVDGNRGLIEFNDLLKRPLESYKYLLATCEKGTVTLPNAILHLDALFVASSNEVHLRAFKEYQDFPSFKARMDLVKMPYLRDYTIEQAIYDAQVRAGQLGTLIAPHATYVAALWAVLSRLHVPDPERADADIRDVIKKLTPLEKAELYAGTREPADLTAEQSRALWAHVAAMMSEDQDTHGYEGSLGASPREMQEILLNAAQDERYEGLSPIAVLDELERLVERTTVYDFLTLEVDQGYHDHRTFISLIRDRYLDRVDNEVRAAMGLVSEAQYVDLFSKYILHVSYALKNERIYHEATGRTEEPDRDLMDRLEVIWDAPSDREGFRRDLIGRVGAWRIDFPGEDINYRRLFPKLFDALEADYFRQQKDTISVLAKQALDVLVAEHSEETAAPGLSADDSRAVEAFLHDMDAHHGYPRPLVRDALGALIRYRYA